MCNLWLCQSPERYVIILQVTVVTQAHLFFNVLELDSIVKMTKWFAVHVLISYIVWTHSPFVSFCHELVYFYWILYNTFWILSVSFKLWGLAVRINCKHCDMAVNCGWSPWSDWGECLGPCGVQSIQWSFRSPNNPTKRGEGKTCRGIYRKARRYTVPFHRTVSMGQNLFDCIWHPHILLILQHDTSFFFFKSHIVNELHCLLALCMYFNVQVSDRAMWRVWVPRLHPSSGRQMDIRSLPVMLLLVQPHGAVRPLLSICCQWVSTGNEKCLLCN